MRPCWYHFWRFLHLCGHFSRFGAILGASCRLVEISRRFFQVLGRFWASFGDPCWSQFGSQDGLKSKKWRFLDHFVELVTGMLFLRRFRDDFGSARQAKNEQKCGSVCSKSLFSVLNIRSISDAFSVPFWEGLDSILGDFSVPRAKKYRSRAT